MHQQETNSVLAGSGVTAFKRTLSRVGIGATVTIQRANIPFLVVSNYRTTIALDFFRKLLRQCSITPSAINAFGNNIGGLHV